MSNAPMHARMLFASQDNAVIALSQASGMLKPPEPDPLNTIALQADSDPTAIRKMSDELTNGANRLKDGSRSLGNAVRMMVAAWKGRRHLAWASHAGTVMDYYDPALFSRGRTGVRGLVEKTAEATAAIGVDLDTSTTAVADGLISFAGAVLRSSTAVIDGRATPEDELYVRQAVTNTQSLLGEFEQTVAAIDQKRLVAAKLVSLLEFSDEGGGMPNDPTEDNLLSIQFAEFGDALTQLDMSATQASLASEDLTAASKITGFDGRSPFGTSIAAIGLQVSWAMTVAWRISESNEVQIQTQKLKTVAQEARDDYLEVEQRNVDSFRMIYPD